MKDFEKIYLEYMKDVYKFLMKLCGNPDVAEELTQSTFAKAFEHIDQFQGRCKISVWLCQIAKYEYYAYYRRARHFSENEISQQYPQEGNMEENLIEREDKMRIIDILSELPEPYREVFILRIIGEKSYRDISRLFGKSEVWARVTYYRAKNMIVEYLGGVENDEM